MESHATGTLVGTGSFRCTDCDYVVSLAAADRLPPCPGCGGSDFVRASLFTSDSGELHDHPTVMDEQEESWLEGVRNELEQAGQYLVYDEDGEPIVHQLVREWTRIGRSLAADVRFDDPTVSRRHALVVQQPDGVRVLDDRSLNGVFVNGERVEWRTLDDGDELVVGRHRLHFFDLPGATAGLDADLGEREPQPLAG
jgi:FHA domain/Zinc-ribbon containing domain